MSIGAEQPNRSESPYLWTRDGLFLTKTQWSDNANIQLTNFVARIVTVKVEDDGTGDLTRSFEIEASIPGHSEMISIPASDFVNMQWVMAKLGPEYRVSAGYSIKDHARAAIQSFSDGAQKKIVHTHTGWRQIDGTWAYLHGGGAIGPRGTLEDVEVKLPEALAPFVLPAPTQGRALVRAIHATLKLQKLAPALITIPVMGALWRSVLDASDFTVSLVGPTGTFKSELAALVQQHFGAGFDARHLPASWSGTDNALEGLCFVGKDALLVIDDFAPASGGIYDRQQYQRKAERVLRGQGNNSGKQRMRADTTLRPPKPPRGTIISTGEDIPTGQSIRARSLIIEVAPGAIEPKNLSEAQADAAAGLYAQAMSNFLQWVASKYGLAFRKKMREDARRYQQSAAGEGKHRRTPTMVAEVFLAWQLFLEFAKEAGAISLDEMRAIRANIWETLGEASDSQQLFLAGSEPAARLVELIRSALSSGQAHLEDIKGGKPNHFELLGWQLSGFGENQEYRGQGPRIGWVNFKKNSLLLDPNVSFQIAQRLASSSSGAEPIAVSGRVLHKRLHEKGFLKSTDENRGTLTVRRVIMGARIEVLELQLDVLGQFVEPPRSVPRSDRIASKASAKSLPASFGQIGQI